MKTRAGKDKCSWQTEYGTPYQKKCGKPTEPNHIWCKEHEQYAHDLYPHQFPKVPR